MTQDPSPSATEASHAPQDDLHALEQQVHLLRRAVTQARALFDASPHPAYLLTPQGRVLDVNTRGAALLQTTVPLLAGRSLTTSVTPATKATFTALLAQTVTGQGSRTGEIQITLPNGQVLDLAVETALQPQDNAPDACHVTVTDVTAFKAAHRALLDANETQAQQLHAQQGQLTRLEEEFESVVHLSAREVTITVTRAGNFLALMDRAAPLLAGHTSLDHAEAALRQTHNLLDSLRQYMRARAVRARMRRVDLNHVLRDVFKDLGPQMAGRDVQVTGAPLPTVHGDSQVLQVILHEYVANALKFTRVRPQVRLHLLVHETDTEYRIGLEDNGIGFNMRYKDKAFELFGRLHPAEAYEGIGLGLAVVRRLCERFGGRAWADGKVDQGATFWFAWLKSPDPG
jgi:signal transduction histidine kinase